MSSVLTHLSWGPCPSLVGIIRFRGFSGSWPCRTESLCADRGILAGTAVFNGALLVAATLLVVRVAGPVRLAWFALCTALLVHSLGIGFLADPWNPYIALIPTLLVFVLAWMAALGRPWALPWLVGAGSFVVGTHVGYLWIVGAVGAVGIVGVLLATRAAGTWKSLRYSMAVSVVVAVAVWLPALVQQATGSPGNLSLIARSATGDLRPPRVFGHVPSIAPISVGSALHLFAHQFALPAPWIGADGYLRSADFHLAHGASLAAPLITGLLFAGSCIVASRRGSRPLFWIHVVTVAAVVGSLITTLAIRGDPHEWLVRPIWITGMLVWVCIGWTLIETLTRAIGRIAILVMVGAILAGAAVLSLVTSVGNFNVSFQPDSNAVGALVRPTVRGVGSHATVYVPASLYLETSGLAVALLRQGIRVVTTERDAARVRAAVELRLFYTGDPAAVVRDSPHAQAIATYRPSAEERAELPRAYPRQAGSEFVVIKTTVQP